MANPGGSRRAGHCGVRSGRAASLGAGFTLIELTVVMAIITILIAITIPVYRGAREHVRQRACMANLYQISTALRLYRIEEGVYPGPYEPVTGEGGLNALYPYYLDNRRALICPDDPTQDGPAYVKAYGALLAAADAMYRGTPQENYWQRTWQDKGFFDEHYSSYNALYNFMGYVSYYEWVDTNNDGALEYVLSDLRDENGDGKIDRDDWHNFSLCDLQQFKMAPGDSLAYWYEWYRWDPEGVIPNMDQNFDWIDHHLHYHLAQQVYWRDYLDDPYNSEDRTRLADNLGRPLWDIGDAPWNPGQEGWYPYGTYSGAFPGLINRNAPDNTIVTRCPWHRQWTVVKVSKQPGSGSGAQAGHGSIQHTGGHLVYEQEETPRDIVLRLDGSTALVRGYGYDWATQPR